MRMFLLRRFVAPQARSILAAVLLATVACASPQSAKTRDAEPVVGVSDVFVPLPSAGRDSIQLTAFRPDLPAVNGPFTCSAPERLGQNARAAYAAFPSSTDTR